MYEMDDIIERTARALVDARKKEGLTQEELSSRSGITRSALARIERGGNNISIRMLSQIARGMGKKVKITIE